MSALVLAGMAAVFILSTAAIIWASRIGNAAVRVDWGDLQDCSVRDDCQ